MTGVDEGAVLAALLAADIAPAAAVGCTGSPVTGSDSRPKISLNRDVAFKRTERSGPHRQRSTAGLSRGRNVLGGRRPPQGNCSPGRSRQARQVVDLTAEAWNGSALKWI